MEPRHTPPPIPAPDGQMPPMPAPVVVDHDWKNAPKIVKGWAYPLTWLGIIVLPLVLVGVLLSDGISAGEKIGLVFFYAVLLAVDIWLNRALKRGVQTAWKVQIVLSALGLLGIPLGTLINGYILSQWFKPETKAWFGLS